jgi:transposase-like protein
MGQDGGVRNIQKGNGSALVADERVRWVKRYQESGVGLKRFAEEHGLRAAQLHYWVYGRPRATPTSAQPPEPMFQEVIVARPLAGTGDWSAEIGLPNGSCLRLRGGTDPAWVGALLEQVR